MTTELRQNNRQRCFARLAIVIPGHAKREKKKKKPGMTTELRQNNKKKKKKKKKKKTQSQLILNLPDRNLVMALAILLFPSRRGREVYQRGCVTRRGGAAGGSSVRQGAIDQ